MNKRGYIVVGLTLGFAAFGGASVLAEMNSEVGAACIAPIAAYSGGMPAVANADALTPEQRIVETTRSFRKVMAAADSAILF